MGLNMDNEMDTRIQFFKRVRAKEKPYHAGLRYIILLDFALVMVHVLYNDHRPRWNSYLLPHC